ncbi:MAG: T9SS type A sorting domain-containing protein, partial [Roseivirga sp.]|nr:T9SS type A sorting domain-containing protein [Roseivirga sp.]
PVSAGEEFTDLPNLRKAEEISIYPNPASKVLTIDLSELSAEEVDIYMYDAAGAPVFNREAYKEKTLRVDVSNYTSGLYIVQFYDGTNVIRKKVMVKK